MKTPVSVRIATWPALVLFLAIGCAQPDPKLVTPPKERIVRVKDTGGTKVSFNRAVDILFVVDDSGSMQTHQENLAANVAQFTKSMIANHILDYHIGVVSSNMDSKPSGTGAWRGELFGDVKFVTRTTPDGIDELNKNLKPGTDGSGSEMFFAPVQTALTPPTSLKENLGFYRKDAYLVVVFVTDADDQSSIAPEEFRKFLLGLKNGQADKIILYGAVIPSGTSNCNRSSEPEPKKIEKLFKLHGGKILGLCDGDFGKKLGSLGDDLVKRVANKLTLSRPPREGTITVAYGSQIVPNHPDRGWIFDPAKNALVFGDDIQLDGEPEGTQVEVDFLTAEY